jgi:hypothetical protein
MHSIRIPGVVGVGPAVDCAVEAVATISTNPSTASCAN